jgi:HSP20 family protein
MFSRIRFEPLTGLRSEMDRLFNEFACGTTAGRCNAPSPTAGFPPVNVWEDERNLFAEAELPGLTLENIEVLVQGNELTIKGCRPDGETEGATWHRRERGVGEFGRVLRLPVEVNADKVQASLRDGVLTITLPKAESVLPRKIEVKG